MEGKDWTLDAAIGIANYQAKVGPLLAGELHLIIETQCPFKPNVAYMPVPRCETCAHFESFEQDQQGRCKADVAVSAFITDDRDVIEIVPIDFGCVKWKEK